MTHFSVSHLILLVLCLFEKTRTVVCLFFVDYATKYPEAIAVKIQDAQSVTIALIRLFSRVGIPNELLIDQWSNFMSELMQEGCRLLKISKLLTSPYRAMSNELCTQDNA